MYNLNEYLDECLREYEREIKSTQAALKGLPDGHLIRRNIKGKARYFRMLDGKETGITKNPDLVKELVIKKYGREYLKRLEENYKQLNRLHLKDLSLESINEKFANAYKNSDVLELISAQLQWQMQEYEMNPMNPEQKTIATSRGVYVRSKSEQIIGNTLEARGIPYRYEPKLVLGEYVYYPDFEAKKRDGSSVYWEHWGLMENAEYVAHRNQKLKVYEQHGIIPWKNLICTYEEDTRDARRIDDLVKLIFA